LKAYDSFTRAAWIEAVPIVWFNNESYTIALLLKGRSGGASTKHLYRSGASSTDDHDTAWHTLVATWRPSARAVIVAAILATSSARTRDGYSAESCRLTAPLTAMPP
jgi:hypothetical protein